MRVMRPNHDLTSAAIKMSEERLNSASHVLVAQVPGGSASFKHRAVIAFGIRDQTRILLRIKELRSRALAICLHHIAGAPSQFHQLSYDLVFTRLAHSLFGGVTVELRVAKILEASITLARSPGRGRIDFVEIT